MQAVFDRAGEAGDSSDPVVASDRSMDDFFQIPKPVPEPPDSPPLDEPPWIHPPRDVIAGLVADRRVIARTDRLVVVLTNIDAFPTGAMLRLRVMGRRPDDMSESDWWDFHETVMGHRRRPASPEGIPDEFLRVGVEFADGRKATNIGQGFNPDPRLALRTPAMPSLHQLGGGGLGRPRSFVAGLNMWLWPLPPAETFDLVIEWPAYGIPVTRIPIEGADVVAASLHSEPAW